MRKFDLVGLACVAAATLSSCAAMNHTYSSIEYTLPTISNLQSESVGISLPVIDSNEWKCLTLNIFHEARSEKFMGQVLVAQVTKARVLSDQYPDSYCEVVYQHKQFSWTREGKGEPILNNTMERNAWFLAENIAYAMIVSELDDNMKNVLHYHKYTVKPEWSNKLIRKFRYGAHIFYSNV